VVAKQTDLRRGLTGSDSTPVRNTKHQIFWLAGLARPVGRACSLPATVGEENLIVRLI